MTIIYRETQSGEEERVIRNVTRIENRDGNESVISQKLKDSRRVIPTNSIVEVLA